MKKLLAILVLLLAAACGPSHPASPSKTGSVPATGTSSSANETPLPQIGTEPACPCPTGGVPASAQPQGTEASAPAVICGCPAILLAPTVIVNEFTTTTPELAPAQVTLKDSGKTFILRTGESFLLNLGSGLDWTVDVDNPQVLSRVKNVAVIVGAQGIYIANGPGQATLSAAGDPLCRKSNPPCMAPSIIFRIVVIVQQ